MLLSVPVLAQKGVKIGGRDPHQSGKAMRHELAGFDPAPDRSGADAEQLRHLVNGEKLLSSASTPSCAFDCCGRAKGVC